MPHHPGSACAAGVGGCGSPANSVDPAFPSPGTVVPTAHPLVASYSVTAPADGMLKIEFGTTTSYGRSTNAKTVTSGQVVSSFVAGMHPQTTYHNAR